MTVTVDLNPELELGISAQAQASGMTVEEYVLSVIAGAVLPTAQKTTSNEERASAFEAWSLDHRSTPLLSDYAISREGIYEDRNS